MELIVTKTQVTHDHYTKPYLRIKRGVLENIPILEQYTKISDQHLVITVIYLANDKFANKKLPADMAASRQ